MANRRLKIRRGFFRIYIILAAVWSLSVIGLMISEWKFEEDFIPPEFKREKGEENSSSKFTPEQREAIQKANKRRLAVAEEEAKGHNMSLLRGGLLFIAPAWILPFLFHLAIEWIVVGFMKD